MSGLGRSFMYALRGVRAALDERNMRVHICFAFYVTIAGFVTELSKLEWIAVLLSIALVISAECLNTALETVCDALHPGRHSAIGRAKDIAAGGTLVCAVAACIVGGIVFFNSEKVGRAMSFAAGNPILALCILLPLPAFLIWILGRKKK